MPTYEYACDACEHAFEEFQSIKSRPLRKCPECGENKLQRLIGTGGGVIFKGSGFYETDYRSESYKKGAEAEKKATEPKKDGDSEKPKAAKPKSESGESKSTTPRSESKTKS